MEMLEQVKWLPVGASHRATPEPSQSPVRLTCGGSLQGPCTWRPNNCHVESSLQPPMASCTG